MSDFKEFQGKTLDAAIAEACSYYDAPREKLEIDIVEDAKSGIFGLVGARKARIRARRAQLPSLGGRGKNRRGSGAPNPSEAADVTDARETAAATDNVRAVPGRDEADAPVDAPQEPKVPGTRGADQPAAAEPRPAAEAETPDGETPDSEIPDGETPDSEIPVPAGGEFQAGEDAPQPAPQADRDDRPDESAAPVRESRRGRAPRSAGKATEAPDKVDDTHESSDSEAESGLPRVALAELDQDTLIRVTTNMVSGLVFPIVGEVPLDVSVGEDRVQVRVDCEDTGLLIGREGQNLAAVQYLAARMITHAVGAQVRVQVDAGDYHSRQDSRLQELARSLADKVRATGRSQSTRPLSAYQRRVIHLTLQDDPDVQTRSSGEGALKRVVVLRRKD